jgi:hypothetical protein
MGTDKKAFNWSLKSGKIYYSKIAINVEKKIKVNPIS